ncbi:MAG: 3-isopropylmalate dehydratase [Gemmatimonadetes bacterium]|jgi:aconitate hydratase/homoaconitate hydratase|nr:3-isopropylmalate dehydratase [Gemmatimonadota bacterium]
MTLTEKILCHHAVGLRRPWVEPGEVVRIRVDWTLASELAWNGMNATYEMLGRPGVSDRDRFYLAIDHTVDPVTLAGDKRTRRLVDLSQRFAKEAGLRHFYDSNVTILHTQFYRDLVQPGQTVIGADSHSSSHGGMGAFSIGLGGADVCVAMVLGETWIQVPEAIQVAYRGRLPFGMTGKDVILKTLGELGRNTTAMERSVEYVGDALEHFSIDFRFTVANMTAEFGGLNGIFPADERTAAALAGRSSERDDALFFRADEDAGYVARHSLELPGVGPQVAKPYSPDHVVPVEEVAGQEMDGAFIGACTTSEEELVLGALVLDRAMADGARPVPSDKRLVVPGSVDMTENLRAHGILGIYERAGFRIGVPGCSMCLGIASDRAAPGENWLSSQNRNFRNRMGPGSHAWLASGPTVAASSLEMKITDPRPWFEGLGPEDVDRVLGGRGGAPSVTIVEPSVESAEEAAPEGVAVDAAVASGAVEGKAQLFGDHVDTDAIIPGEHCHLTDPKEIAGVAFCHVRPDFAERIARGESILVAGEGWGSGSSREHAAWALKYSGVTAVVAKSFAFIHKRNLVNEAIPYLVVTDPCFHDAVEDGTPLALDFARGVVRVGEREFEATAPSGIARCIQSAGGIVPAVREHGAHTFDVLTSGVAAG